MDGDNRNGLNEALESEAQSRSKKMKLVISSYLNNKYPEEHKLFISLVELLNIPDSCVGMISCIQELIKDWSEDIDLGIDLSTWQCVAISLHKTLLEQFQLSTSIDRIQANQVQIPKLRFCIKQVNVRLSQKNKKTARAIRGLITYWHLSNNKTFGAELLEVAKKLIAGDDILNIFNGLNIADASQIVAKRDLYSL